MADGDTKEPHFCGFLPLLVTQEFHNIAFHE